MTAKTTEQDPVTPAQRVEAAKLAIERDLQEWESIREGSPLEVRSKGFLVAAAINGLEKLLHSLGGSTEEGSAGRDEVDPSVHEDADRPWQLGVMHERGWEGDHGLLICSDGKTPAQRVAEGERDEEFSPGTWVAVRCRRVRLPDYVIDLGLDVDWIVERIDEAAQDNGMAWNAPWGEGPIVDLPGSHREAEAELHGPLREWARKHLSVDAWEVHPDDRSKLDLAILERDKGGEG